MREFVPVAVTIAELAGGYEQGARWVQALQQRGLAALRELGLTTDVRVLIEEQARQLSLVDHGGSPQGPRLAQLLLVLDILSALPAPHVPPPPVEPLVYTVPPEVSHLVEHRQRLDLYIADAIRSATGTLHLGGPFWNVGGFEQLRPVLEPCAECTRG